MAVEDIGSYDNNANNKNKNKNMSLPLPTIDEVERFSGWESQLCVPQDSLDDIDWFPNFTDEVISLDKFFRTPEHESISLGVAKSMTLEPEHDDEDDDNSFKSKTGNVIDQTIAFVNKKQRSKRGGRHYNTADDEWTSNARRKCSHCLTDDTPQWRMGPSGPKTLCNACGVRYKSGRLVPEYRPAASPTFDASKHSNFHKKILRRRHLN